MPTHQPLDKESFQPHLFSKDNIRYEHCNSFPGDKGYYVTVQEAIDDLPPASKTDSEEARAKRSYPNVSLSKFSRAMRSETEIPYNHLYRIPSEPVLMRLRALKPGMRLDHIEESLRTKSYYFNAYGRLNWGEPAKTITKSCNYLGSGCFGHPIMDRGITMREAARLQSFPDDFRFYSTSEPRIAKMIGSAVPPLLAKALALETACYLQALEKARTKHHYIQSPRRMILKQLTMPLFFEGTK